MADDKKQPIVIKKINKGGHGHHGGSWKVAYADFVTAMMAFFLLLWLLGISDDKQREGISDWFRNPSGIQGPGGASTSLIKLGGAKDVPQSNERTPQTQQSNQTSVKVKDTNREIELEADKQRLDQLLEKLKAAVESSDALKNFKDQLLLEITPDGLRIQIIDKENRPMFASASAKLKPYTKKILDRLSKVIIQNVPNKISISGHTDATPFAKGFIEFENEYGADFRKKYDNWELSADRANAARRRLVSAGMPRDQIGRVVGLADSVLFDKDNPRSPVNRRISIIVLNKEAAEAIAGSEGKVQKLDESTRLQIKSTLPASSSK